MAFLHRGTTTRHTVVMPVSSRKSIRKCIAEIILSHRMGNIVLVGLTCFLFFRFSSCDVSILPAVHHLVYFHSPGFWARTCAGMMSQVSPIHILSNLVSTMDRA